MKKKFFASLALAMFLIGGVFTTSASASSYHSNYHTIGQAFFNDVVPYYISFKAQVSTYYDGTYVDYVQTFGTIPKAPEQLWDIYTYDIGMTNNGSLVKYTQSPYHYSMIADPNFYYNGHRMDVYEYVYSGTIKSSANMYAIESYNGWSFNDNYVEDNFSIY